MREVIYKKEAESSTIQPSEYGHMTIKEMKNELYKESIQQDLIIKLINGETIYFPYIEQFHNDDKDISFVYFSHGIPWRGCYRLDNISGYELSGIGGKIN